ncbi:MAG: MFS transporter [Candidatus Binataceae bacterium]|nr:MFS transporter [Candidatus Binataceae bacterium]
MDANTQAAAAAASPQAIKKLPGAGPALAASFLGWTLDAFDFFILVFVLPAVGREFHRSVADIAFTITATLAMRPVGALIFGWMADRYGRRLPLMIDIIFYSVVEVLSGLAPTYWSFLLLRALYGIGMGGEWGIGTALAMEAVPVNRRGMVSGFLQEGYAVGYLLAAGAYFFIFPHLGWRPMFFLGGAPALLVLYIRTRVPESETWRRTRPAPGAILRTIRANSRRFAYLVVLLTAMGLISHGTQDLYPTFLEHSRGLGARTVAGIAVIYNFGAICGGLVFGHWSDFLGRRRAVMAATLIAALIVPLWVYPQSLTVLIVGAFLMQFMVQGAWGVMPAHLAELSPPEARGLFTGLTYHLGVLFAANTAWVEALMGERIGYANGLAIVAGSSLLLAAIAIALGQERRGAELDREGWSDQRHSKL